ncbi:MAG: hypothetical protein OEW75_02765, partial [Cyclobacteriaceae bacterium]|nr:hypothetical protein [Cyclobacteriaceae bacterium]
HERWQRFTCCHTEKGVVNVGISKAQLDEVVSKVLRQPQRNTFYLFHDPEARETGNLPLLLCGF